jgi:hypothetical protein
MICWIKPTAALKPFLNPASPTHYVKSSIGRCDFAMIIRLTYPINSLPDASAEQTEITRTVIGTSVTGIDLNVQLLLKIYRDQATVVSRYTLQSSVVSETTVLTESNTVDSPVLPPKNQRALDLLHAWMAESDELGDAWWDDFERDLAQSRPKFREIE